MMPRRSPPSGRPSTTSQRASKDASLRALIDALPPDRAAAVFTHSSWAADRTASYERLEFLGDSVLELAVARTLYDRFPEFNEGRMAKVRSHVVSRASCAVVARELELGERLREQEGLPVDEVERLSRNRNVLAALLEAAIAAVYLEHGFERVEPAIVAAFEPGVAVVVGPNGSGKSNVSDSILWATGSLSPGELRAEKPDDVLFSGSSGRGQADFCEVDLLFDNSDDAWPDLPYSEVSVARRLHRGGEGQYLVNRAAVRRIDLVELLSDVGLGGGLRSVISQGRVETVLNSKPSERRELIEEAAGLGRFKRRRHRAELKLARVAVQVDRARDLEDEVRKRLRPLALQATAAERAEKLGGEISRLQAAIATLDLARLAEKRAEAEARRTGTAG